MSSGTPCHEQLAKMRERLETERARYAHMALKVDTLERELLQTRVAFWCAVASVGGAVRIPKSLAAERPTNMDVERYDDFATGETVYRARLSQGEPQ